MKYIAGYNAIGYMPDNEPCEFDSLDEALEALAQDMDMIADHGYDSPMIGDHEESRRLEQGAKYFRSLKGVIKTAGASIIINGWNYWVTLEEEPDEDN
jgi:hypothetical protein